MKKKRPPQQTAAASIEKPEEGTASDAIAPPETPTPEDEPAHAAYASSPEQQAFFQAVGIIKGNISWDGDKAFVKIGGNPYQLSYSSTHKRAYDALKKEIDNTGITEQTLIVYPRVTHYPGGKKPYSLGFQLAGFAGLAAPIREGLQSVLGDLEFRLCGLWQFIPVCRVPCISVFKNFNKQRLEYIKSAPVDKKVNFMKASHVPLIWKDAPVQPFRFNPKLEKDTQGKASFVQLKAKFNSERNIFEFVSLQGEPSDSVPSYLKSRKEDKAEAMRAKLASRKAQQKKPSPKPKPMKEKL